MESMGMVQNIFLCTDWNSGILQAQDRIAFINCDDGAKVQVDADRLKIGDRVRVGYQGIRWAVVEKLLF